MNPTDRPYTLHGFDVSYFTAKARVAMRYKQIFLEEKRADVGWLLENPGYAFIPAVSTPEGEVWQDTSDILDALEARHPNPPLYPRSPVHRIVCALIEVFADEVMMTSAMHTRWGTEEGEASTRRRFGAMTGSMKVPIRPDQDASIRAACQSKSACSRSASPASARVTNRSA